MGNYGTNIGKGSNFGDSTTITNTTNIQKKKNNITISIAIGVIIIVVGIAVFFMLRSSKTDIVGKWVTEDGETIEFLSDGTLHEGGSYDSLNADTYEIIDDEYLKWGKYSASWIEYKYTYWNIKISGKHLTLTMRDNPENVIELTKE